MQKSTMMFQVNGELFLDRMDSRNDDDELVPYELYKMDTRDIDDDDDFTTPLDMHIQMLPQGVIINSNVFLWEGQWHTVVQIDEKLFRCAVCQVFCDRLSCENHVETPAHLQNLDKYKPLKKFDLNIIRKINTDLHCGVCNEIIDIIDYKIHENGKNHEQSQLAALNKVSDFMYDSDLYLGDRPRDFYRSYAFNTIPDRHAPNHDRNATENNSNTNRNNSSNDGNNTINDRNYSSTNRSNTSTDRNTSTPNMDVSDNHQFYYDAVDNVQVYEDFSEEEEMEEGVEETTEDLEEYEEYNPPCQGVSYASMASKPTIELPKFLKIDLGTKEFRVKYESWHMILSIKPNRFHCMVCNKTDLIRFKSQHCISCEHLERLARCIVLRAYENYLIRRVDDKLYHCGHCNNLQFQNQMEDHIKSTHPMKNRNFNEINTDKTNTTMKNKPVIESKKTESDLSVIVNKNVENVPEVEEPKMGSPAFGPPKIDPNFDIFGEMPLTPFGCELWIPVLNFNLIMKTTAEFYCVVCDTIVGDVKDHVQDKDHVAWMNLTPFIKPFANNLTRAVRSKLHCSICNVMFSISHVHSHNMDQPHTTALAKAMGMRKSQKPENTKRVTLLNLENQINPATAKNISTPNLFANQEHTMHFKVPETVKNVNLKHSASFASNLEQKMIDTNANIHNRTCQSNEYLRNMLNITNTAQNAHYGNMQHAGQTIPHPGQNLRYPGQNVHIPGQHLRNPGLNIQNSGQNLPNPGHNLPIPGQYQPNPGHNIPMSPNLKTKPVNPVFNSMFPTLPPVDAQSLKNQFVGAPIYFNPPRPTLPITPNITPNESPKLLTPKNIISSAQNLTNKCKYNQELERKTLIITDGNDKNGNYNTRSNMANTRSNSTNSRRDSVNSRRGSVSSRRDSVNSRSGSVDTRRNSENSTHDSINSRTDNYLDVTDNMETDSQSDNDESKSFDEQEMVFIKFKTTYFKITAMSYNSLLFLDKSVRYCFVCSCVVYKSQIQKHVESRKHVECLIDNKYLDKYGVQLFRQMYLIYHCGICNVIMTRKEIKQHLDWPGHVENYNISHLILNKKTRKELKSGLKEYQVKTQKEAIFHNVNEPNHLVRAAYKIDPDLKVKKDSIENRPAKGKTAVIKKNKMVIQNNVVMKIPFAHWHGITTAKNITKCFLCQMEIKCEQVLDHVETNYHSVALGKTFEKIYYPALIRKIKETVNCMTCNLELPNNEYMIHEHISGRKHNKNLENIVNETSSSESYADCYEEFLNI